MSERDGDQAHPTSQAAFAIAAAVPNTLDRFPGVGRYSGQNIQQQLELMQTGKVRTGEET
jgi:hypothetical protein